MLRYLFTQIGEDILDDYYSFLISKCDEVSAVTWFSYVDPEGMKEVMTQEEDNSIEHKTYHILFDEDPRCPPIIGYVLDSKVQKRHVFIT